MAELLERLRLLRLERDVSYRDLAIAVGIPEATLHRALNGKPINERTGFKIRRFLEAEGVVASDDRVAC